MTTKDTIDYFGQYNPKFLKWAIYCIDDRIYNLTMALLNMTRPIRKLRKITSLAAVYHELNNDGDYELFSHETRKRKFIPFINHPDAGDELMMKNDVRWKLVKNQGIDTWTAVAKIWKQFDNAMDAKNKSKVHIQLLPSPTSSSGAVIEDNDEESFFSLHEGDYTSEKRYVKSRLRPYRNNGPRYNARSISPLQIQIKNKEFHKRGNRRR